MIWFTLALFVVSFIATALLTPSPDIENARPDKLNPDNFPRATENAPIPLILGKVRMDAPNTTWWGAFRSEPIREKIKVSIFKSKWVVVGHNYYAKLDLAVGMGPKTVMTQIFLDDKELWVGTVSATVPTAVSADKPSFWGGFKEGGGFSFTGTYYPGALDLTGNPVNTNLEDEVGAGSVPGYLGTAHLWMDAWLGESAQIRKMSFVLENYTNDLALANDGKVGVDMNPAEAIYQIMTDTWRGMGIAVGDIDIPQLQAIGATLLAEGNGASVVITSETNGKQLISEILRQIDGLAFQDPETGKIKFVLIRDDYDVGTLETFDEADVVKVVNFSRSGWDEVVAQVKITFPQRDRDSDAVAISQDMATFATLGRLRSTTISMPFVYDKDLAAQIASRERAQISVPLFRIKLEMNRSAYKLRPGSVFKLDWPDYGFTGLVLRVQEFDLGSLLDGKIVIQCLQDSFALNQTVFASPSDSVWTAPVITPVDITATEVIEAPRFMVNGLGFPPPDGFVMPIVMAAQPSADSNAFDQALDRVTSSTAPIRDPEYTFYLGTGVLDSEYHISRGMLTGIDTTEGMDIGSVENGFTPSWTLADIQTATGGLLYVGGEWMGYTVATDDTGGDWTITNIYRGLLGTRPKTHAIGTRVWEFSTDMLGDGTFDNLAEDDTLYYKVMDRVGAFFQDISEVSELSSVVNAHISNSPVRPADLQIDASRLAPPADQVDKSLTWVARNRDEPTIPIEQDAAETPDQTETYDVDIYIGGVLSAPLSSTGVTSPYTIPFNSNAITSANVEARVTSRRTVGDLRSSTAYGVLDTDPGPRLYWRLKGTTAGSFDGGALAEIEMYSVVSGADVTTGGTPTAGSTAFGGTAAQAFDGDKTTSFWAGASGAVAAGTSWVAYQFASPTAVKEVEITSRDGADAEQVWDGWDLEWSDDGITWNVRRSFTDTGAWAVNESRKYAV